MAVTEIKDKSGNVVALEISYDDGRLPLTLTMPLADELWRAMQEWRRVWRAEHGRYRWLGNICATEGCNAGVDDRSTHCYPHRDTRPDLHEEGHDDGET